MKLGSLQAISAVLLCNTDFVSNIGLDTMASVKVSDIITKYEGSASGDFAEWLEKLELVAKLQKVEDLHTFLPLFLNGPAFAVYQQLSEADKNDFGKLKSGLLSAFGVDCYAAYEQLQTLS